MACGQQRPVLSGAACKRRRLQGRDGAASCLLGAGDRGFGPDFYTGDKFPRWKNNLFIGGMRQGEVPRSGQLERIDFNEKWEELHRESMFHELQNRIRDVRQGPDGLLYVLTEENDGALLKMEPWAPPEAGK